MTKQPDEIGVAPPPPWIFGDDAAYQLIARASWPWEREENRDAWAATMRNRPELLAAEIDQARARLESAIAAVQPHARPEQP